MLPSRGLSRSGTASALCNVWSARIQPARSTQVSIQVPIRHFSQAQARSIFPSRLHGASSTPICLSKTRATLTATSSGVFGQHSGASRNLSLWPFSSKQQPLPEAQSTSPSPPVEQSEPITTHERSPEGFVANDFPTPSPPESSSIPTDPVNLHSAQSDINSFSDLDLTSVLDIPEQIGYLKALGLDFGWGPTSCCEWLVEHVYIYSGMPWWATLAAVGFAWRAVMFVPTLNGSKHQALLQQVTRDPAYIQAKAEFDESTWRTQDRNAQIRARDKMMRIKNMSGASTLRSLAPVWSIPFSFGMFRLFRGMAAVPVPSLETGGLAWFTDLTVHDPYFILPLASVGLMYAMFNQTRAATLSNDALTNTMQKWMKYAMPPVMFLCTAWLPACLQWFFLTFSVGTVIQTTATLNPAVRRWADLPPLPSRSPAPTAATVINGAWKAPRTPSQTSTGGNQESTGSIASLFSVDKKKEAWEKAQAYEKRRVAEEKEKAYRRMEDLRRKQAEKER